MSLSTRGKGPICTGLKPLALDPFLARLPIMKTDPIPVENSNNRKIEIEKKKEKNPGNSKISTSASTPKTNPLFQIGIIKTSGRRNKKNS